MLLFFSTMFNAMLTNHGIYHGKYMYMQQWNTCQDIFLFVYYHSMSQLHVYLFYNVSRTKNIQYVRISFISSPEP